MAFGKKQKTGAPQRAPASTAQNIRRRRSGSSISKPFLIGVSFFGAIVLAQSLVLPIFGRALDRQFSMATAGESSTDFGQFVNAPEMFLDVHADGLELSVHKSCAQHALGDSIKFARTPTNPTGWADHGFEERVKRVADYVACSISKSPQRFCAATSRHRLAEAIRGYTEIKAHVLARVREQAAIGGFSPFGFREVPKGNGASLLRQADAGIDPALLEFDARIKTAMLRLAAGGVLAAGDFQQGIFGSAPEEIQALFATVKPGPALC
jgi:hypothetical protein